jgi:ATP/maltotriose-dependent transcriptional regulator MalT
MTNETHQDRIEQAWQSISKGRLGDAKAILSSIVDVNEKLPASSTAMWNEIADAEEVIAAISFMEGDLLHTVSHAQQSIQRSSSFRPLAQFLAAEAMIAMGDYELAVSRLTDIADQSGDRAIALLALTRLSGFSRGRRPLDPDR